MLILSAPIDGQFLIGDPAHPGRVLGVVTIVDVRSGGTVRLGFEFPKTVAIHRKALLDKQAAAAAAQKAGSRRGAEFRSARPRCLIHGCRALAAERGLCEAHLSVWSAEGRAINVEAWAGAYRPAGRVRRRASRVGAVQEASL